MTTLRDRAETVPVAALGRAGQDARICAAPGCDTALNGRQAHYCGERCRKAAHRERERARRPAPVRTARTRRQPPERQEVAAAIEQLARDLERETLISLRQDPGRWPTVQTTDLPRKRSDRRAEP